MKQIVIDKYLFIIYIISRLFIIKNNMRVQVLVGVPVFVRYRRSAPVPCRSREVQVFVFFC